MAQLASPRSKRRPRIEIIPFIDVMFFLLATFMMVSLSMIHNQGIELKLPTSNSAKPIPDKPQQVTLSITKDGLIYADQQVLSMEQLGARLADLKRTAPETVIIVQGDYGCVFGKVVEVFDQARNHGLTKLIIRTQKHS